MPIGEIIGEVVVQGAAEAAMDAGGEAIKKRWGWKGCLVAFGIIVALIGLLIWYLIN